MGKRKTVKPVEPTIQPVPTEPLKPKQVIHERPTEKAPYKTKPFFCPYCGAWTSTTYNKWGYRIFKCCGISMNDFHVKRQNKTLGG